MVNKKNFTHTPKDDAYLPLGAYGIVGDLHTIALVGLNGSIDFMCWPRFDSASVFASLLDAEKGGFFQICPMIDEGQQKQIYLPDTNILLTRFLLDEGVVEVSDFMPIEGDDSLERRLVRRVKVIHGSLPIRMVCLPRFDYGRMAHTAEQCDEGVLFVSEDEALTLRLRCECAVEIVDGAAVAEFTLDAGQSVFFILEDVTEGEESPAADPDYVSKSFKATSNFWREWVAQCTYSGRWQEMINRSALVLKLLTSKQFGSIVAAPTFGLPEEIGGGRNWDYRYTWIRDASFTLYAFIRLGYRDEAVDFMNWIERVFDQLESPDAFQPLYGIDGRSTLTESELDHFEGYKQSRPVRIGNAAYDQVQMDIYGELMDTVYLFDKYVQPVPHDLWHSLTHMLNWLTEHWGQLDEGVWEVRGGKRDFLYSRLMCWVALDRGVRLGRKRSRPAPLDKWRKARDEIYYYIFENFWDEERETFVQYKGGTALDASTLVMPMVKFISPHDPRWLSTLRAIEEELVEDSLVFRYRDPEGEDIDGLSGGEGTFSLCSFWYAECLSRSGDLQQARYVFEKMLGYANPLGLYAEELGLHGEQLGNYPQAFTHIALISAAYDLNRRLSGFEGVY